MAMNKIPFKRFIITFLFFNKGVAYIVEKLKSFGYHITDQDVSKIFDEIRFVIPKHLSEYINGGKILNLEDEIHVEWLHHFGVYEFYDYIINKDKVDGSTEERPYFKWCSDCLWVHGHRDVMSLINIFLYNDEDLESISKIVMFKYKKKIGVDALELYRNMFWCTEDMTAKEAIYYCDPFKNNTLIVRKLRAGGTEFLSNRGVEDEANDGSDVPFTFHDSSYIKWKIGYRDFEVPGPSDFMKRVKEDSYFKYLEVMSMTQSIEIEEEEGQNEKIGCFDSKKIKKRNVEEQRVKMAKHWFDMYIKADHAVGDGDGNAKEDFFKKMDQLELGFQDYEDEKIMSIDDNQAMFNEIVGDMNPAGETEG